MNILYKKSKFYIEENENSSIVSMIGTSWNEKSNFLNFLLNHEGLSVDGPSNVYPSEKHWENFSFKKKGFTDFDVILMNSFDKKYSDNQMSVFLLSSALCFSNTVIIQVMQNEIQNENFIEDFAFFYFQSALISLKHVKKLPEIVLVIFVSNDKLITDEKYILMVNYFHDRVNVIVSSYAENIDRMMNKSKSKNKKNFNEIVDVNKIIDLSKARDKTFCNDYMSSIQLSVNLFCLYNKENDAYIEFKKENNNWDYNEISDKTLLEKIKDRSEEEQNIINFTSFEHTAMFDIKNDLTSKIQQLLHVKKKVITRSYILECIYTEIIHSSLIKFREIKEEKKIIEMLKDLRNSLTKFKKQSEKINESRILKLKNDHENNIKKLFVKYQKDIELFHSVYQNFKYLSAIEFSNNFSLDPSNKKSLCYKFLRSIMLLEDDSQTVADGLENIKMNISLYECLYFDIEDFKKIIRLLLYKKINLNECIYELYNEIIDFSINNDYRYKAVLEKQINHYKQLNFKVQIFDLISILESYTNINQDAKADARALLKFFKNLHTSAFLKYNKPFILCDDKQMKLHTNIKEGRLRSKTIFRALTPTASGLTFGLINSLAPVSAIPGLSLSLLFIGAIATSALIAYPFLKKKELKTVTHEMHSDEGYYIEDVIVIKQLINGTESDEYPEVSEISKDKKKYNYRFTFSVNKDQLRSAKFSVKFFMVCVLNETSVNQVKIEKQFEIEKNYDNSVSQSIMK
ncbi:hypothetical protein SteCoe_28258 [Stentor coeruleus]|uniref:Uncharacterized protein n=1 Tax=Stentor coeruleus TaxID=5963 RepID=A0A1R2B8L4_9CILI|nr:hypothetical protein SteCoe_28258 [Stentor coeruleus]